MNTYVEIDSSYRDREVYPNPADFVVSTKNYNNNILTQDVVLYPFNNLGPLIFYIDENSDIQEFQNLPLMYKTNDPHIIQLDELSVSPTYPTDAGIIVQYDLYPRGSIPLGQANQFYTGDILENFSTGETREIVSFTYETGKDLVFQTMEVLWATIVGDIFKIGVSPTSATTIPPSNIYNFYRGKYIKIVSGKAKGLQTLVIDFKVVNKSLSVFTLENFNGIIPTQGDLFQIVSDRRWFAVIDTPFSNTLPSYPSYQEPLPVSALQFTSNTIYSSNSYLDYLYLNEINNITFREGGNKTYLFETLDTENLFWKTPWFKDFNGNIAYYIDDTLYSLGYTNSFNTAWSVQANKITDNEFINNILNTEFSIPIGFVNYYNNNSKRYMSIETTNSIYFFNFDTTYPISISSTWSGTLPVLVHCIRTFNDLPYIVWSTYNSTTGDLTYYFGIASDIYGTGIFSSPIIIAISTVPSTIFNHYIRKLDSIIYNDEIFVTLLTYDANIYTYKLYISNSAGISWRYSTPLLEISTLSVINKEPTGLQYAYDDSITPNGRMYFFTWDSINGLSYKYTDTPNILNNPFFTDKKITDPIAINNLNKIIDAQITNINNKLSIGYIRYSNNKYYVEFLNNQPFEIELYQQYRIRKKNYILNTDILPFVGDKAVELSFTNNYYHNSVIGDKFIHYSTNFNSWIYTVENKLQYSSDTFNWNTVNVAGTGFTNHRILEIKEVSNLNRLTLDNNYSDMFGEIIFSITKSETTFCAVGLIGSTVYTFLSNNFLDWINQPLSTSVYAFTGDGRIAYGDNLFVIVRLFRDILPLEKVILFSPDGLTWTDTDYTYTYFYNLTSVCWSNELSCFLATGITDSLTSIYINNNKKIVFVNPLFVYSDVSFTIDAGDYTIPELITEFAQQIITDFVIADEHLKGKYTLYLEYNDPKFTLKGDFKVLSNWRYEYTENGEWNASSFSPILGTPVNIGMMCIVGNSDKVYLRDAYNYYTYPCPAADWRSVCWSPMLNIYCVVAIGDPVMISSDGMNWVQYSSADSTMEWVSICWGGSIFCAVSQEGVGNRVMTSSDGMNWTAYASADDTYSWRNVCYADGLGKFCAVGIGNQVMLSSNGMVWTSYACPTGEWVSVCWSQSLGLFCAVSTDSKVMTSTNGINWNIVVNSASCIFRSVVWCADNGIGIGFFYAIGTGAYISRNGILWEDLNIYTDSVHISWFPTLFSLYAVSHTSAIFLTTTYYYYNSYIYSIIFNNDDDSSDTDFYVKLGYEYPYIFINTEATNIPQFNTLTIKSSDGNLWEYIPMTNTMNFTPYDTCWSDYLNIFLSVGNDGVDGYTIICDGISSTIYKVNNRKFQKVIWVNDILTFCAITDNEILTSSDGINWILRYTYMDKRLTGISWSTELRIFLVISENNVFISTNSGISWSSLSYMFINSTYGYTSIIWDTSLNAFCCAIYFNAKVPSLIYNVEKPRNFLLTYFNSPTKSLVGKTQIINSWTFSDAISSLNGEFLPPITKFEYITNVNMYIGITSNEIWFSSEGKVWSLYMNIDLTQITDILWVEKIGYFYLIDKQLQKVYYTNDLPNVLYGNKTFNIVNLVPLLDNTYILSKIVWSPYYGFIITTLKQNANQIDFIRSSDGLNWDVALHTNKIQLNNHIAWNDYMASYIGLSTIDGIPKIILSMKGDIWFFFDLVDLLNYDYFSFNNNLFGFISNDTNKVLFSEIQGYVNTNMFYIPNLGVNYKGIVWIYNKQGPFFEDRYVYYNDIYSIIDYKDNVAYVDRNIVIPIPYNVYFEVMTDSIYGAIGSVNPFKADQDKCYTISLLEIILPNKTLATYIGNQISFYPYIYVKIQNEGTTTYSKYCLPSNNKNAQDITFKIAVSQFTSDPSKLPFINLSTSSSIISKFNLNKPFRFSVYLPNGELFKIVETDNFPPEFPNQLLQISATFLFEEV